jgi:hypothetical protein
MIAVPLHRERILRGRGQNRPWLTAALALLIFWGGLALSHAATFSATLDRDTITLGENATLSLTFTGGQPKDVPSPPNVPNLQIAYVGPSSQFSFINGQVSSTVTHNFVLAPRQAGDYTIPALTVQVGSETLSSQPVTLKVLKPNAPPPEAVNSGTQLAFIKLVLPKQEVYVGETFVAQLQVYLNGQVQRYGGLQPTSFPADGFNIGNSLYGQTHQAQVGNAVYTVVPVNVVLKAIKTGSLTVGPVTANVTVELPSNRRPRDMFEEFMRSPFDRGGEQKQFSLTTEAASIKSLPLPREKAPPDFTGAVGNYTMSVEAGPTNVAVGDPITLKVQITGRGSIDALTLPGQTAWHDFKVYPPKTQVKPADQLGIQGTKFFEQFVEPQNSDIRELPPISFSFFDPEQKAYVTRTQPAIALTVRPGGATPLPTVVAGLRAPQNNPPPVQDIVPNKQRLGAVGQIGPPLAFQTWFLALQSVPVLAFVGALVWRRRTDELANNPRLRRRRLVAQIIRDGLIQLRQLAEANQVEEFFATFVHLLQEGLGERLDLPASAITEAVIEERLRPRGVPETTLGLLQELFQTCNLARYAPLQTSQELAALIPKLETVLQQLEEVNA